MLTPRVLNPPGDARVVSRKQSIDLGVGHQLSEPREASFRLQHLRCAAERGPSGQRQRRSDTDAPHAQRGDVDDTQADVAGNQKVDRFRPYCFD